MKISCLQKLIFLIFVRIVCSLFSVSCLAEPQPAAWNLFHENLFFVGREDQLQTIHSFFKRDDRRILALTGGPGFGKTQIAKKYAQKFADDYELIWWFDTQQNLPNQFEKLAIALNTLLPIKDRINPSTMSKEALIDTINNILRLKPIKYLFIFDNAEEYARIEKFIPYAHQKFRKNVLLTSRNANIWTDKIEIGKFKRQESLHLIRAALPQEKNEDMKNLAEVLSDYPLGLSIAVGFIKSHLTTNISKYTDIHLKNTLIQQGKRPSTLLDSYSKDAQTTLSISLKAIEDDSKNALETLFFMSLLNSKDIPDSYIDLWLKKTKSLLSADEAIKYVYDQSLIEINRKYEQDGDNKGWGNIMHYLSIHDLTHQLINEKLSVEEKKKLLDTATDVLLEVFGGRCYDFIKRVIKEPIHLLHAQKLCENAQKVGYTSSKLLQLKVCIFEFLMGSLRDFEGAKVVLEEIEKDLKRGLQLELYYEALFKIDKAFFESIYNANYAEAISNLNESLSILTSSKQYHEERLRVISNLAQYHALRGETSRAAEFINRGKAIFKKSKSEHYNSFYLYNCSYVLSDQGKLEESMDILQKVKITPQFGADYPTLYHGILCQKIEILIKQRRLEEAQKNLDEYENIIKKFYQERYKTYVGLGNVLYFKGVMSLYKKTDISKVIQYLSEAIKHYDKVLRGDKKIRHQGRVHLLLGKACAHNKDFKNALKEYLLSEDIYDRVLKEKTIDEVSDLYMELAIIGEKLKDETLTQKYLTAHIETFGLDHPRTEKILKHLDQVNLAATD